MTPIRQKGKSRRRYHTWGPLFNEALKFAPHPAQSEKIPIATPLSGVLKKDDHAKRESPKEKEIK